MILKFHAETPVVKGFNRSCVYDLPRNKYDFVPNDFLDKIIGLENQGESFVDRQLNEEELSWLDLFIENEYCFYTPEVFKDCFPKINFTWKNPFKITNAIIDISDLNSNFDFLELENLNCRHIVIRFKNIIQIDEIFTFLKVKLNDLTFKSVDVLIERDITFKIKSYNIFKSKLEKELNIISNVTIVKKEVSKTKGRFRPNFIIQTATFAEAQNNNLYFNRKLYINTEGFIKNGIESEKQFVFSNKDSLEKIIDKSNFKKYGMQTKIRLMFVKIVNLDICVLTIEFQ